ncbi:GIY-YIG nuclease family protein [Niabella sp. CC-SYL272]|uniref:GIY-YIG nuclease family protein n=1 Tax=Niabella agricola TaxID=2891571 RepID=UPI001F2BDDB2|nr:GIY-YIG nuclease family protein [Niabella agricola]MCF3108710.1 GIY-YIG nuclease family protein [Niabella agricola]
MLMIYTVYVLYAPAYDKHYTGFTANIELRLKSHNEFGKDWTARHRPWKLIYTRDFDNKVQAMDFEKWLKTGAGRDFIKTLPY